jgi:N-acetylglucosaminyl-diphospho-decaprenol L-rhamnosyltransferase
LTASPELPEIDVVVLAWNDGDMVARAVDSALSSTGTTVRVVVIDNGSDVPVAIERPGVEVVHNAENKGVAGGRNQGVTHCHAALVCFLDSDAELEPATLAALAEPLLADDGGERVGLSAPVFTGQPAEASAGRAPTAARKLARLTRLTDRYQAADRRGAPGAPWWDVDFAIGACQLFRRAAYDDVGGLDERYFYGPEDVDFCLRLRERGWRVVQVGGAHCLHPARRRFRKVLTRRGMAHAIAVARHLWRHRGGRARSRRR